ncbi:hypothetical protein [Amaricoccus sp.]|uniref:hypothetical protein n=1 Tax=Amaricoccus sp. TaxID=1872485 RepID=UPI001B561095|nr:hypothetical protein [Amaricoccus sp.]MBP7242185.1 hypothetical protein [Amaricoccus sp.]
MTDPARLRILAILADGEMDRQADLALFTLDGLGISGAGDPLAALVLCGAHRADRVMIAGRWTVEDGRPVGVGLARLRAEHGRAARRFLEETA